MGERNAGSKINDNRNGKRVQVGIVTHTGSVERTGMKSQEGALQGPVIPCHLWSFPGFTPTITTPGRALLNTTIAAPRNRTTVIVVMDMLVNVGVGGNDETGVSFRSNPLAVRRIRYCRTARRW